MDYSLSQIMRIFVKVNVTDVHGKTVHSNNEINLNKIDVDLTNLERGM